MKRALLKSRLIFPAACIFFFLLCFSGSCNHQSAGYSIALTLRNNRNTIYLYRYRGSSLHPVDTARLQNGRGSFSGTFPLAPGMYLIGDRQAAGIPLFISNNKNQHFGLEADMSRSMATATFRHSPENQAYSRYLQQLGTMDGTNPGPEQEAALRVLQDSLAAAFPGTLMALSVQTIRNPDIPEPPVPVMDPRREERIRNHAFRYTAAHFFDSVDFSDSRLTLIPAFEQKLSLYFRQLVYPHPDTLRITIAALLNRAAANDTLYNHCVRFLYDLFREAPMHWSAEVYNYIGEQYILADTVRWKEPWFVREVRERVIRSKMNPAGSPAADLILKNPGGDRVSLYHINAPLTILYFYNPDCEACLPVTDRLAEIYNRHRNRGIRLFAVYVDQNRELWLKYIREKKLDWIHACHPEGAAAIEQKYDLYALPMIYLLDRDKKVIVRDLPIGELEEFLFRHQS